MEAIHRLFGVQSFKVENWERWKLEVIPTEDNWWFEYSDDEYWYRFLDRFWWMPTLVVLIYWVGVYFAKRFMEGRKPLSGLTGIMVIYNMGMGTFAIVAIVRLIPLIQRTINQPDWVHRSLCYRQQISSKHLFWIFAFSWSKLVLLADTFFLVFKKKTVPFFQIYHHSIMVLAPAQVLTFGEPINFWFGIINLFQHAVTYPFLAFKALKFTVPKIFSTLVVLVELGQMIVCLIAGIYTVFIIRNGGHCVRHPWSIAVFNFMYFTMLVLVSQMTYSHFFNTKLKKM